MKLRGALDKRKGVEMKFARWRSEEGCRVNLYCLVDHWILKECSDGAVTCRERRPGQSVLLGETALLNIQALRKRRSGSKRKNGRIS